MYRPVCHPMFRARHQLIRSFVVSIMLLLSGACASTALALDVVSGSLSDIYGRSERVISYRNQEHMWETADGRQHLFVNLGRDDRDQNLALYTRVAENEWQQQLVLPRSDQFSSLDGFLDGGTLHLVFSDSSEAIIYAALEYFSGPDRWAAVAIDTVYDGAAGPASIPTISRDSYERLWAGFTLHENDSGHVRLSVLFSEDQGLNWSNSLAPFGSANSAMAKATRVVKVNDGIGIIYTDEIPGEPERELSGHFLYRADSEPPGGGWSSQTLWSKTIPADELHDPFGTHFNALTDHLGRVHVLYAVDGQLVHRAYPDAGNHWSPAQFLSSSTRVAYMQLSQSMDGNRLYAIYNQYAQLYVLESVDNGASFHQAALLRRPMAGTILDSSRPRVETPSYFSNFLPVLSQLSLTMSPDRPYQLLLQHDY